MHRKEHGNQSMNRKKKVAKGHRQKGSGSVVVSCGEVGGTCASSGVIFSSNASRIVPQGGSAHHCDERDVEQV